jgi:hypothetical protein
MRTAPGAIPGPLSFSAIPSARSLKIGRPELVAGEPEDVEARREQPSAIVALHSRGNTERYDTIAFVKRCVTPLAVA